MAVMASISLLVAARVVNSAIANPEIGSGNRKGRGDCSPRPWYSSAVSSVATLAPVVAHQAEQHQEQVDEVEVERQRAHHRLAARDRAVVADVVEFLDLLRVV